MVVHALPLATARRRCARCLGVSSGSACEHCGAPMGMAPRERPGPTTPAPTIERPRFATTVRPLPRRAVRRCKGCGDPLPRERKRWCVECALAKIAAGQRAYRERNRAKIAAGQRAYYERNRAKIAAGKRAYYERNRAKIAAGKRAYYERNRAKIAAGQRASYRAKHRCHRCETPLEPQPGRPPRLCPKCRRKS